MKRKLKKVTDLNSMLYRSLTFLLLFKVWGYFSEEMLDFMRQELDSMSQTIAAGAKDLYDEGIVLKVKKIRSKEQVFLAGNIAIFSLLIHGLNRVVYSHEFVEACEKFDIETKYYRFCTEWLPNPGNEKAPP